MNGLDYVFLLIIAWGALDGYQKGLIPVVLRFAGLIIAVMLASRYSAALAVTLNQRWEIRDHAIQILNKYVNVPVSAEPTQELATEHALAFSEYTQTLILGRLTSTMAPSLVSMTADLLIHVAAFLLILGFSLTALVLISSILTRVLIAFVGHSGNRVLGVIAGICRSAIVVCVIVVISATLATLPSFHGLSMWVMTSRLSAGALHVIDYTWPLIHGAISL